jgi:DNA topoisomerase-6 subunit B
VTRKPRICDFKPVVVEVALARFKNRNQEADAPVQLLRFANRVPLQFDKSGCAITWAIESVNWKSYGLQQPKDSLPLGPYVFAVSVVSPFIKFKNASKETIDASEELVAEIRLALIQAGQKLSRHIKKESKEADLERKLAHIEQFGPILVDKLATIVGASESRRKKAEEGLRKILGRDSSEAMSELEEAQQKLSALKAKQKGISGSGSYESSDGEGAAGDSGPSTDSDSEESSKRSGTKKVAPQGTVKVGPQSTKKLTPATETRTKK